MEKQSLRSWEEGTSLVFGIDSSLISTGLALLDYNTGHIIGTTAIGSAKLRGAERLNHNFLKFQEFVNPSKKHIHIVVLEDYAYARNSQRGFQMAEWTGIIKLEIYRSLSLEAVLVNQSTLKKFITGNGHAPDATVALEAYKRFSWEFPTPDEVDACALAELGRRVFHLKQGKEWENNLNKKQLEAVSSIAKQEGFDAKDKLNSKRSDSSRRSNIRTLQIRMGKTGGKL